MSEIVPMGASWRRIYRGETNPLLCQRFRGVVESVEKCDQPEEGDFIILLDSGHVMGFLNNAIQLPPQVFSITSELRWSLIGILQQKWQGSDGDIEWRDVPIEIGDGSYAMTEGGGA